MPTIDPEQMKPLIDEIMKWTCKCKELEVQSKDATGDVAEAYILIHKDYLWKLQAKIGKLYYYVCGSEEMNPFDEPL
jgi:hypothetical protein